MSPVMELRDWSEFKKGMNGLLVVRPEKTVVLTVDLQNNYLDKESAAAPLLPEEAERVLGNSKALLAFARDFGMPVIHVYTTRRPAELERGFAVPPYGQTGKNARLWQTPQASQPEVFDRPEGSRRSQVPEDLVEPSDLHVTTKKTLDGYLGTDLYMLLSRALKPETVVVTGINTDTCVYSTTFSTANLGYNPIVISDCVASMRGRDSHEMALELMSRSIAWVWTLEQFKGRVVTGTGSEAEIGLASHS